MRKWESVVSISKAGIYAPSFAPPFELKSCFVSFFKWNNLLTFYSHPQDEGEGGDAVQFVEQHERDPAEHPFAQWMHDALAVVKSLLAHLLVPQKLSSSIS